MGREYHPDLRGFDSYELKLGDELRGERASKGKSLLDVQRDLRIRADYIDAIENADASAFPFSGFAAGYVRSYARYLGLDGDDVYRRFCEESGFEGVKKTVDADPQRRASETAKSSLDKATARSGVDQNVISTRFIRTNQKAARNDFGASLRGVASIAVLCTLVVGLGYGGWNVLQNLQRVGFAPLPSAPEVHMTAPDIFSPGEIRGAQTEIDNPIDDGRAALATLYAAQEIETPRFEPRDGPILSINPSQAGIYAKPETDDPAFVADIVPNTEGVIDPALAAAAAQAEAEALKVAEGTMDIYATADAWVRVRDGERAVLFTGILGPGERFTLPDTALQPELRAGNAGAVYVVVGGAAYGPLGTGPEVAQRVILTPEMIRATYPAAVGIELAAPPQRAASVETSVAMDAADPAVAVNQ